jgi:hypothetical protein
MKESEAVVAASSCPVAADNFLNVANSKACFGRPFFVQMLHFMHLF